METTRRNKGWFAIAIAVAALVAAGITYSFAGAVATTPDEQAAIDLARQEIASNSDVLGRATITRVYYASAPRTYRVEFSATYRADTGAIRNGELVCTVDLNSGNGTIRAR